MHELVGCQFVHLAGKTHFCALLHRACFRTSVGGSVTSGYLLYRHWQKQGTGIGEDYYASKFSRKAEVQLLYPCGPILP